MPPAIGVVGEPNSIIHCGEHNTFHAFKPSGVAVSSALSTWPKERSSTAIPPPSGVPMGMATTWPTRSGQPCSCPTPPPSTASASIPAPPAELPTASPRTSCCSPQRTATAEPAIPKTRALLIWTTGILGQAMPATLNLHPAGWNSAARPCAPTVYASWASNSLKMALALAISN